jgi:ribonuclease VapC
VNLFDASALLCFLKNEAGAAVVERELLVGGACSAANWCETAQKLLAHGQDWTLARGLLLSYGLVIEPVSADDAELAARLWRQGSGMSLADRIAIATAHRLAATVWTADKAWGTDPPIRQVR